MKERIDVLNAGKRIALRVEDADGVVHRFHDVAVAHAQTLIRGLNAELIPVICGARVNMADTSESEKTGGLRRNDRVRCDDRLGRWKCRVCPEGCGGRDARTGPCFAGNRQIVEPKVSLLGCSGPGYTAFKRGISPSILGDLRLLRSSTAECNGMNRRGSHKNQPLDRLPGRCS